MLEYNEDKAWITYSGAVHQGKVALGYRALKTGMHVVNGGSFGQSLRHAKDAGTDLINHLLTGGSNVRGGVPVGRHHQLPQWQRRHIKKVSKMLIVSALPDLPRVSSEMMEQL